MTRQSWMAAALGALVAMTMVCLCVCVVGLAWSQAPALGAARATLLAQGQPSPTRPPAATPRPSATPAPATPTAPQSDAPPTATPPRTATPAPNPPAATETPPASATAQAGANTLASIEGSALPARDLWEIARRYGRIAADAPRVVSETDPGYALGDTLTFTVSNVATEEDFQATATLRAQTTHASWWVQDGMSVDQGDLEASARVFEKQSYPTNRALFGSEWSPGVDGDPRVHIFLGEVPGVGGYFSSADEFPRAVNPNSNEKEIFYINLDNAQPGDSYFDGILAHEFQHMIHWNTDRNEELWVNEGLSELAIVVNDFEVDGTVSTFARDPDIPVTRWDDQTYPFYGSAFLFLNYFYQRFGEAAVTELVQHPADGPRGFQAVLADEGVSFEELFGDWAVAMLVDDPSLADGRFGFRDDSAREPTLVRTVSDFPVVDGAEVHQYGLDFLRFAAPPDETGTLQVEVTGDPTVALLPTEPHSGDAMAWSNRGDDSNSTLTRAFDLSGLADATLRFWAWYDLESDYDYSYIAISTDGGARWKPLRAPDSTDTNPHGNSFGSAFTGRSGQDDDSGPAEWREQVVDLSPYVGGTVLLRFETITDDALNENGFVVDDIAIPQLGYTEDFEAGLGGWEAAGWARVDNRLPQRFIVRAVAEGDGGTQVFDLPLDAANRATLSVDNFGSEVDQVTLIVIGATHLTSEKARYTYAARLER